MSSTQSLRIIVTGLIGQHPLLGGVSWDYLQYPVGLQRLGHDVYYFEDSGEWPYTIDGGPSGNEWVAHDCTANVEHLATVMDRFGMAERWAYRFPITPRWFGLSDSRRAEILQTADLIINVSGTLERPLEYRKVPRLIYLDSDPVFTQVKLALPEQFTAFCERVKAHDRHFSFGESLSSALPDGGYEWRATRQPILLDEWRPSSSHRDVYTTVMSWTSYKPLRYGGKVYAQKDREFSRFLTLPNEVGSVTMEVAVAGMDHLEWQSEALEGIVAVGQTTIRETLTRNGWTVADPLQVCAGLDAYREYVETSKAEWSVAKNGYVQGNSGWFSCRSACYLAAGRPVIVQDTGFSSSVPTGHGVLSFATMEQAAEGIREVEGHYDHHARAARAIAVEYFDSSKVLNRLLQQALDGTPMHTARSSSVG